ncbi:hypothetical protein nbrc107696_21790 [Gordonia spumicola]|uniref:ABC transporter domain-containing protein n=1 Tax=Gordonia spumicola TaxID=589161 RepID=A0A7I9V9H3_9ACTN|nr:ATP-binding cassette domain-containing protein [Gordonia spumicola]GEE01733.1 hypothetical protein nbrc107696_21790 [Gordonia spumicola]
MTSAEESAIVARGITQRGPWGPVYGPIDLDVPAGGLTVLRGPAGSGRTALQMTLAGRMKPKTGHLSVFGRTSAKQIFAVAGLAAIDELDAVYNAVRVVDLITEQVRWDAPWYRLIGKADAGDLERVCRPAFGDLPLPGLDDYVDDLSELDRMLLRIALADTKRPPLLVIGSIDQVTSDDNQKTLVRRLVDLGRDRTVVTSTVNPLPADLGHRLVVDVPNLTHDELTAVEGRR